MINKPIKSLDTDTSLNGLNDKEIDTIKKMLQIRDILLFDEPKDKEFMKKSTSYLLDFIIILNKLESENDDYTDIAIQRDINRLYARIFKNRRH
jgi:hypothetical protein